MTPDRISLLRAALARGYDLTLTECQALLDIAKRFARLRAILEPLRALEAAATDGPWHVQGQGGIRMDGVRDSYVIQGGQVDVCKSPTRPGRDRNPEGERANFQCIAAARNALPALLREIQETP